MDSMVQVLLDIKNETERSRSIDEIIRTQAAPLVRNVLQQRLGFYINPDGRSLNNPEAEDLYNDILLGLTKRLDHTLAEPERFPIDDYRRWVIDVATDECRNFERAKSDPHARMRNNLLGMIRSQSEFKVWEDGYGRTLCGFGAWEGRRISIASSDRLARLKEHPESFKSKKLTYKNLLKAPYPKLVAEIFNWLGDPIEFEDLVDLVQLIRPLKDQPAEAIEPGKNHREVQLPDPAPQDDVSENRMRMKQMWEEIKQLPPKSRLILCLSPFGEECDALWDLLLASEVISLAELAESLEISPEQLAKILRQAPMGSQTLADFLGATTSQVNKWRYQAVTHLRGRNV